MIEFKLLIINILIVNYEVMVYFLAEIFEKK